MAETKTEIKDGVETSEFKTAKSGSFWGIVSIVIGAIISVGSFISEMAGNDTKLGIIVGGVIGVVGGVQKILTDRGYIASRTAVKVAASETKKD